MIKSIGLTVGVASSGRCIRPEWAHGMMVMIYPSNISLAHMLTLGKETGEARDRLVEEAQKVNSEFIWFVDDDTVPPHFAISKLIYEMRQHPEAMAIGGIYCMKQDPPSPVVYRQNGHGEFWDWAVGDVFECTAVGTGCMLVRMSVFQHLTRPWFSTSLEVLTEPVDGKTIAAQGFSDDIYFCNKLVEAGFKILAHGGILCDHWDMANERVYSLPQGSLPYKNREAGKHTAPLVSE
jgi:hypothetical protein